METRGEYEEETSKENRQPEAPILREPAPQMEAPDGQKDRDEQGCEAKEKVENRLDRRSNGPHDVPRWEPGLTYFTQKEDGNEGEKEKKGHGQEPQCQDLLSPLLTQDPLLALPLSSSLRSGTGHDRSNPFTSRPRTQEADPPAEGY